MSGSETGLMTSREPFTVGLHKPQQQQQPLLQNMRLAYGADGSAVYKPVATSSPTYHHHHPSTTVTAPAINNNGAGAGSGAGSGGEASAALPQVQGINVNMGGGGGSGSEPLKRKRGRPRKYGPDGTMALGLTPTSPTATIAVNQSGGGFSPALPPPTAASSASALVSPTSLKKARGRPPGSSSKKHQLHALGSSGFGFTPHVITVKAGEDLSSKIMSFSQNGPRAVCILSANGAISNVTLRQPATSGGTVTYEGRFEILSLSGSFLLSENGGQRSRTGGLSVSLSGPDGRVLGGGVAGLLTAASPVQVVVASFVADGRKESKSANQIENLSAPPKVSSAGQSSSPSRGTLSESSGGPGSPLNQSTGACNNNNPQGIPGMPWK